MSNVKLLSLRTWLSLYRFSSYSQVTDFWLVSTPVLLNRIESDGEDRRDGFRLVADRVCERYNSAVCQFSAELVGRSRGVHVRNDLELVAQRHRSVVFDGHPDRLVLKFGITEQVGLNHGPIPRVVHVVEDGDLGDANPEFAG